LGGAGGAGGRQKASRISCTKQRRVASGREKRDGEPVLWEKKTGGALNSLQRGTVGKARKKRSERKIRAVLSSQKEEGDTEERERNPYREKRRTLREREITASSIK